MSSPSLRLHAIAHYDRSAKARWLLTELNVEFEERWLDREKREFESPEYLKLNPMGRVPTLELDGRPMFESSAICATIADLYLERGFAPALTAPERAEYQQWMYFAATTLDPMQSRIMIIEDIPAGELQKSKESALQTELSDAVRTLDQVLLKNDFLVANRFSAADICVSYHLNWLCLWPELEVCLQSSPSVLAYLERMKARPAAVRAKVFSYRG